MTNGCLEIIEIVLLLFSTVAAAVSSYYAYKQISTSKQVEFYPALSLVDGTALPKEKRGYPVLFSYKNVGKGLANLKKVDSDSRNIEIDIDNPPIAGAGDLVKIKPWIREEKVNLINLPIDIYYFDTLQKCYRTEVKININYPKEVFLNKPSDLYFIYKQDIIRYKLYDYKFDHDIENYNPSKEC